MTTTLQTNKTKFKAIRDVVSGWVQVPSLKDFIERTDGSGIVELVANSRWIRSVVFGIFDKRIKSFYLEKENVPMDVRFYQYYMARAVLNAISRLADQVQDKEIMKESLTKRVIPSLMKSVLRQQETREAFLEEKGQGPPGFLTISPTKACNLNCTGCYANSSAASSEKLDYDVFNRILDEKAEQWGSWFTVISGGEPFMYKSNGKTLLDAAEAHPDQYFLVYTNGTLIDDAVAKRLAELGNVTPAVSVEGYEKETDERRGKGTYKKIMQAFENLKKYGVPYGVSITALNYNADMLNQELFDHYVKKLGVYYIWIFQYMPIGRKQSLDLLVQPEQRLRMYRDTRAAVENERMFIADFWNSGGVSCGCVSAGKEGGYLYIDWNGNVTPCVFNPYSPVNINDLYAEGKTLSNVLDEPFFDAIKEWQNEYGLERESEKTGNWIRPCPIKDHYQFMYDQISKFDPKPIDSAAEVALKDEQYREGLIDYGNRVGQLTDPVWQEEVIEPELRRKGR